MALYKGLRAIAKRMGWPNHMYVLRMVRDFAFPAYQLPFGRGWYNRMIYCTDDESIHRWLASISDATREMALATHARRVRNRTRERASTAPSSTIDAVYGPVQDPTGTL